MAERIEIIVTTDADTAAGTLDTLADQVEDITGLRPEITVQAETDDASDGIASVGDTADDLDGTAVAVDVSAPGSAEAVADIESVAAAATAAADEAEGVGEAAEGSAGSVKGAAKDMLRPLGLAKSQVGDLTDAFQYLTDQTVDNLNLTKDQVGKLAGALPVIGVAIGLAVSAWSAYNAEQKKAAEEAAKVADAYRDVGDAIAAGDMAAQVDALVAANEDLFKSAEDLGVPYRELTDFITGAADSIPSLEGRTNDLGTATSDMAIDALQARDAFTNAADGAGTLGTKTGAASSSLDTYAESVGGAADVAADLAGYLEKINAALDQQRDALDVATAIDTLETSLQEAGGAAYAFGINSEQASDANRTLAGDLLDAKSDVLDYAEAVGDIPPEKLTEILALLDKGKIAEAEAAFAKVSRGRTSDLYADPDTADAERELNETARDREAVIRVISRITGSLWGGSGQAARPSGSSAGAGTFAAGPSALAPAPAPVVNVTVDARGSIDPYSVGLAVERAAGAVGPGVRWMAARSAGGRLMARIFIDIGDVHAADPIATAVWDSSVWDDDAALWAGTMPNWTEISCRVRGVRIDRGRRGVLEIFEPGRAVITVDNADGWASWSPDSPGPIAVGAWCRVRADDQVLFTGGILRVADAYSPAGDISAELVVVDPLARLGQIELPARAPVGALDTAAARIARVLKEAGITPDLWSLDPGGPTLTATDLAGSMADQAQRAAVTAGGHLFADRDARIVYRSADWLRVAPRSTTPQAVIGNDGTPGALCATAMAANGPDSERIVNRATYSGLDDALPEADPVEVSEVDGPSGRLYGPASFTVDKLYTRDPAQLATLASRVLAMRSEPRVWMDELTLSPIADPNAAELCSTVDLGDRLEVNYWQETEPARYPSALSLPGTWEGHASTRYRPLALEIAGDIDIRVRATPTAMSTGPDDRLLYHKAYGGGVWFMLLGSGQLHFGCNVAGVNQFHTGPTGLTVGDITGPLWMRATREQATGVVRFYKSTDNAAWTDLGTSWGTPGPTTLDAAWAARIGDQWDGWIYAAEIRAGIDGPLAASPDFSVQPPGTDSFVDAQGIRWDIAGAGAYIVPATSLRTPGTSGAHASTPHGPHLDIPTGGLPAPVASSPDPMTAGNVAARAIDGDTLTYWQPDGTDATGGVLLRTLSIGLGALAYVSSVTLDWHPDGQFTDYTVDVGGTVVATVVGNTAGDRTHTFAMTVGDRITVRATAWTSSSPANYGSAILEMAWVAVAVPADVADAGIDIRFHAALDPWRPPAGVRYYPINRWNTDPEYCWLVMLADDGNIAFQAHNVGEIWAGVALPVAPGEPKHVRIVYDAAPDGRARAQFFTSDDGAAWEQFATHMPGMPFIPLPTSTSWLEVGGVFAGSYNPIRGDWYSASVRDLAGNIRVAVDFTKQPPGAAGIPADDVGVPWYIGPPAAIVGPGPTPATGWGWSFDTHVHGIAYRISPKGRDNEAAVWDTTLTLDDASYWTPGDSWDYALWDTGRWADPARTVESA